MSVCVLRVVEKVDMKRLMTLTGSKTRSITNGCDCVAGEEVSASLNMIACVFTRSRKSGQKTSLSTNRRKMDRKRLCPLTGTKGLKRETRSNANGCVCVAGKREKRVHLRLNAFLCISFCTDASICDWTRFSSFASTQTRSFAFKRDSMLFLLHRRVRLRLGAFLLFCFYTGAFIFEEQGWRGKRVAFSICGLDRRVHLQLTEKREDESIAVG